MIAAAPLFQATGDGRQATGHVTPPDTAPGEQHVAPSASPSAPLSPVACRLSPEQWGDPRDYESRWWEHLRLCGVTPSALLAYGVQLCTRPDERRPHPARCPRLYYRYPVTEEDGVPLTYRLAAVDGEHPRSRWEWEWLAQPDLIYEPVGIVRGAPLLIVGDVLGVWVLGSLGLPACTFLCPASSDPPGRALAQIATAGPSSVLVVDNERPALPGGAMAVARALRAAGVPAGYARLRLSGSLLPPDVRGGATMADLAREHDGDARALWRALLALAAEHAS